MSTPQQITAAVEEPTPKQSGGKAEVYPRPPGVKKEMGDDIAPPNFIDTKESVLVGNTDVTAGFLTGGGDEEDETLVTNATMMHVLTQLGELTSIVKEDRKARAGPGAERGAAGGIRRPRLTRRSRRG